MIGCRRPPSHPTLRRTAAFDPGTDPYRQTGGFNWRAHCRACLGNGLVELVRLRLHNRLCGWSPQLGQIFVKRRRQTSRRLVDPPLPLNSSFRDLCIAEQVRILPSQASAPGQRHTAFGTRATPWAHPEPVVRCEVGGQHLGRGRSKLSPAHARALATRLPHIFGSRNGAFPRVSADTTRLTGARRL